MAISKKLEIIYHKLLQAFLDVVFRANKDHIPWLMLQKCLQGAFVEMLLCC